MKRVLSFLLCCTLCIGIFAYRPVQVKAVAGVDDVAVGAMSCAAFLESIGLPLSATGGAGAVSGGITAVAGEYAAATGAAASGEAVLGSIAAGTMISTAGTIILTAAAVAACAALAYWLVDTYLLGEDGNVVTDVSNIASISFGYLLSDGSYLLVHDGYPYDWDVGVPFDGATVLEAGVSYSLANGRTIFCNSSGHVSITGYAANLGGLTSTYQFCTNGGDLCVAGSVVVSSGDLVKRTNNFSHIPSFYFGDLVSSNLFASPSADFSIPEIQPNQQMEITIPSAAPGSTLPELVEIVPQQIADNEFTASYTIDDLASEPDPGTSSMLDYVADIWRKIKALPETISNALKSVFEPDAALLQEITTTFNNKFGWLDVIYYLGVDLCNLEPESQPPVIYIHLEDAEGQFRYGGTEKALDMSWYQPYKEDVDNILSGFMWLAFLWLVFKRAADIINGAGMVSDYEFYTSVPINQPRLGEHKK